MCINTHNKNNGNRPEEGAENEGTDVDKCIGIGLEE